MTADSTAVGELRSDLLLEDKELEEEGGREVMTGTAPGACWDWYCNTAGASIRQETERLVGEV